MDLKTKTMPQKRNNIIFREIGGIWRRVDSPSTTPPTLAEFLNELGIIIDNNAEFVRIKQYHKNTCKRIEYRAYGGKIRINICEYKTT